MNPPVQVIGAQRLTATTYAAAAQLADMRPTHATIAARMVGMARARTPRRTGRLAASNRPLATKQAASVTAGTGLRYARVIHNGWPGHNIAPQPWLTDTLQATSPAAVATVHTRVDRIVGTIHGAT